MVHFKLEVDARPHGLPRGVGMALQGRRGI